MIFLRLVLTVSHPFFRLRSQVALENLALRHQLADLKRSVPRPKLQGSDRRLWILLVRFMAGWRDALVPLTKTLTVQSNASLDRRDRVAEGELRGRGSRHGG